MERYKLFFCGKSLIVYTYRTICGFDFPPEISTYIKFNEIPTEIINSLNEFDLDRVCYFFEDLKSED